MRIKSNRTWGSSAKAVSIVALLLLCTACPMMTMTEKGDTAYADGGTVISNPSNRYYVSLGDSTTNGYGLFEYFDDGFTGTYTPDRIFTEYPDDGEYSFGLNIVAPDAYPSLVLDRLNENNYREAEWELIQLATSGMRMDELRYLLDDGFYEEHPAGADGFMPNAQLVSAMESWARDRGHDGHDGSSDGRFCQTCMDGFREYYKGEVSKASLITLNLGNNNFGASLTNAVYGFMNGEPEFNEFSFSTYLDDDGYVDALFEDLFDAALYEVIAGQMDDASITSAVIKAREAVERYETEPEAVRAELSEYFEDALEQQNGDALSAVLHIISDASEELAAWSEKYREKARELALLVENEEDARNLVFLIDLLEYIVSSMVYGVAGYIVNYDASLGWILDACGDDVEVVVIGVENVAEGLTLSLDTMGGYDIPLGTVYGGIVDTANLYMEYMSPYVLDDRVAYIEAPDAHTYFDQFSDDPAISPELWFHLLSDFGVYYHDDCPENCFSHLQTLVDMMYGIEDLLRANIGDFMADIAMKSLVNAGIFHVEDGGYVLDPKIMITPEGLDRLSHLIKPLKMDEAVEGIDNISTMLRNTESVIRNSYDHDTLYVSSFVDGLDIDGIADKVITGAELTTGEYALLNVYVKYLLSSGVGCHPDAEGYGEYADAVVTALDGFVLKTQMEDDIAEITGTLERYLSSSNADVESALAYLDESLAEFLDRYDGNRDARDMAAALENNVDAFFYRITYDNIVVPIEAYLSSPGATMDEAVLLLETEVESATETFGPYYPLAIQIAESYARTLIDAWASENGVVQPGIPAGDGVCGTLVSIGDSVAYGTGLDDRTDRYAYLVAERLGLDPENDMNLKDLSHPGLRVRDILSILAGTGPVDEYAEQYADYITNAGDDYLSALVNADVIVFEAGDNDFRYIIQVFEQYLSGEDTFEMDFSGFDMIDEEDKKTIGNLQMLADELVAGIDDPEVRNGVGLVTLTLESILYSYIGFTEYYQETISIVGAINPSAKMYAVGMHNQFDGVVYDNGMFSVDIGGFYEYGINMVNSQIRVTSGLIGAAYADVRGTSTPLTEMADAGSPVVNIFNTDEDGVPLIVGAIMDAEANTHPSVTGHAYMADRISDAMGDLQLPGHGYGVYDHDDTHHWLTCTYCGAADGERTFHEYDREVVDEKYLKSPADDHNPAYYYESCVCGAASDDETFIYGNPGDGTTVETETFTDFADGTFVKTTTTVVDNGSTTVITEYDWTSDDGLYIIDGTVVSMNGIVTSEFDLEIGMPAETVLIDGFVATGLDALDLMDVGFGNTDVEIEIGFTTDALRVEAGSDILSRVADMGAHFEFDGRDFHVGMTHDVAAALSTKGDRMTLTAFNADASMLNDAQRAKVGDRHVILVGLEMDGREVHDLGGTASVQFDHRNTGLDDLVVYHVDEDGGLDSRDTEFKGGRITFTTETFSFYMVGTPADDEGAGGDGVGDIVLIAGAVAAVIAVIAIAAFVRTRNNR